MSTNCFPATTRPSAPLARDHRLALPKLDKGLAAHCELPRPGMQHFHTSTSTPKSASQMRVAFARIDAKTGSQIAQ